MAIIDKSTLVENIKREIVDNSSMLISPYDVRHNLLDIVDSAHILLNNQTIATANFSTPPTRTTIAGEKALGKLSLANYTSIDNSAFGYHSLQNNYNGAKNTALGSYSLSCNVFGSGNTALGYTSLGGNVFGHGNVGLGNSSLQSNKHGNYNIAIGHGAGYYHGSGINSTYDYKFYLGSHSTDALNTCEIEEGVGPIPLMYGELDNRKLGIGVKTLHDYGNLQVSGAVSPSLSGIAALGHAMYPWQAAHIDDGIYSNKDIFSIDDHIYISGGKIGMGTASPSGAYGLVTVAGSVIPHANESHDLGALALRWKKGYFKDLLVDTLTATTYNHLTECLYECKTLYLATSGICSGETDPCGYLPDADVDGAGLVVSASGDGPVYLRSYKWTFSPSGASISDCMEDVNEFSVSSWNSNISINIASGSHLQTDRVIGRESLSLLADSGCFGVFMQNGGASANDNKTYVSRQRHVDGTDIIQNKSDVNFLSSGTDYKVSYSSLTSGVVVGQRLISRTSRIKNTDGVDNVVGFEINYRDEQDLVLDGQAKDRFTVSSYDDAIVALNAFTIMRSSSPGLVGVTNSSNNPLPNTIFNVQSTGNAVVRVTAPTTYDATLQLLGRANDGSYGLDITYDEADERADLSMISSSSKTKVISIDDNNVGISVESPVAKLSIGGDVSLTEFTEGRTASNTTDAGKLFVTASDAAGECQKLIFQDECGNQTNLVLNPSNPLETRAVYTDDLGNTVVGKGAGATRPYDTEDFNTAYGWATLNELDAGDYNTAIGALAGSGVTSGSSNTMLGAKAGKAITTGGKNIFLGYAAGEANISSSVSNNIIIGFDDIAEGLSSDYNFMLGNDKNNILLTGKTGPSTTDRYFKVSQSKLAVSALDNIVEFSIDHSINFFGTDKVGSVVRHHDTLSAIPDGGIAFVFAGSDGSDNTLLSLRHDSSAMSTTPSYFSPSPSVPYAELKGDLRLLGAIRFSDGTSIDLSSNALNIGDTIKGDTTNKRVVIGSYATARTATLELKPATTTERIQEWKDSDGNVVSYMDQLGNLHIDGQIMVF